MLKYEAPAVYQVIMRMTPDVPFPEPKIYLIEIVCNASNDSSLQKGKFNRYLELYRNEGIYCKRPKVITPERKRYYERIRDKKLAQYLRKNKVKVEQERQIVRMKKLAEDEK